MDEGIEITKEMISELKAKIRKLNHCPECMKYLKWPPGEWEGYYRESHMCQCEKKGQSDGI